MFLRKSSASEVGDVCTARNTPPTSGECYRIQAAEVHTLNVVVPVPSAMVCFSKHMNFTPQNGLYDVGDEVVGFKSSIKPKTRQVKTCSTP